MDAFLKEEVQFEMPATAIKYKESKSIRVEGLKAFKTVTRTVTLKDETETELTQTVERELNV
jgi:hypothetical protein